MSHKVKINFLRTVNTQKTETKKEIGIRLDAFSRQLLANPKASYTFSDISTILNDAKTEMHSLNDNVFDSFSKSFLGLLGAGGGDAGSGSGEVDTGMMQELESLRSDNENLNSEVSRLRSSTLSTSSNEQVFDLQKRLGNAEINVERKQVEIQKLQIQLDAAKDSSAGADTAKTYIKQINKIKTEMDLIISERNALEGSVKRLEATLKNNENDLKTSREELTRKNIEIDSFASKLTEVNELQNQNDQLKEAVIKAGDKIKQLTRDMDDLKDRAEKEILKSHEFSKQEILSIQHDMDDLKRTLNETQDEKELLIIDSQETTQAVQYFKDITNTSQTDNKKMKSEIEGLEQQLQIIMSSGGVGVGAGGGVGTVTDILAGIEEGPSAVEVEEQKHLKESLAEYRVKETSLNDKILVLENKLSDLNSEIDLKSKQIDVHVNRVKELQKNLNSMKVEIEDLRKERDKFENSSLDSQLEVERINRQLSNATKEKERIERDTIRIKEELEDTLSQQLEITERAERIEKELNVSLDKTKSDHNREKKVSDFFRRELERLPKYVILFVLNEVRRAKLSELQRTIHRPALWVKREVQSLVQEGWVNEVEGGEAVELIKDFPPIP